MAKLQEDIVTIKLSKLVKDSEEAGTALSEELISSLEAVVQELAGAGTLVEIEIV
jgi:hypothetical protein